MRALYAYGWPGNVRELANLIERLAIMYPAETVEARHLPAKFQQGEVPSSTAPAETMLVDPGPVLDSPLPENGIDLKEYLNDLEIGLIRRALDEASGVVAHAAKLLGMRRTTLVEKIRKFGIARPDGTPEI
jgi:sigma-54 specific flagellar transcriptional regulator A